MESGKGASGIDDQSDTASGAVLPPHGERQVNMSIANVSLQSGLRSQQRVYRRCRIQPSLGVTSRQSASDLILRESWGCRNKRDLQLQSEKNVGERVRSTREEEFVRWRGESDERREERGEWRTTRGWQEESRQAFQRGNCQ